MIAPARTVMAVLVDRFSVPSPGSTGGFSDKLLFAASAACRAFTAIPVFVICFWVESLPYFL